MRTSESLCGIAAALSKAQGEMPAALKDGKSNHGNYATLGSVIAAAAPVLSKHGLSFVQMPSEAESGYMALTTRILHSSGEWIEDTMRAAIGQARGSEVQAAGSVISYLRRYALSSALGITAEDDDGNGGQQPAQAPARPAQAASRPAPTTTQTADQGLVVAINRDLTEGYGFKASERVEKLEFIGWLAKVKLNSSKDLTPAQATTAKARLSACPDQAARDDLVGQWVDAKALAASA